jgi:hypothetical protein
MFLACCHCDTAGFPGRWQTAVQMNERLKMKGQSYMSQYRLSERAILMRLSVGLPGKNRKDRSLSDSVKREHGLGQKAGSWVKQKYPNWALEPIEKIVNEARAYHAAVTLPFDAGIGILPGVLIVEYGDRMRQFRAQFGHQCQSHFRGRYQEMIDWAKTEHNGTFDPDDYPAIEQVMESFYFTSDPLPVPDAGHFESNMLSLPWLKRKENWSGD